MYSAETFLELHQVLSRSKFRRYVSMEEAHLFLGWVLGCGTFIDVDTVIRACRDANDDKFLELAVCGNADFVISGDQDLLVLREIGSIPIVTAAEFLDSLDAGC